MEVVVSQYDKKWPRDFSNEAHQLHNIFSKELVDIRTPIF